ncbi:MAG TPA: DUF1844 domain-containing protein [Acidobacteriaceae bacterium]|jgi:hypothetical protein
MPEKEPQFTVTDRRKFTLEGELRDEDAKKAASAPAQVDNGPVAVDAPKAEKGPVAAAPFQPGTEVTAMGGEDQESEDDGEGEIAEPTAEESAQQGKDYQASSRQLDEMLRQADTGAPANVPMNFDRLVQSIYMTAAMQMGAGTAPNEQPRIDILGARQSIDMLGVLEEKTRGNLTDEEKRLLQSALFDLRMSFLEITNAIASSAHRPPGKPGVIR